MRIPNMDIGAAGLKNILSTQTNHRNALIILVAMILAFVLAT